VASSSRSILSGFSWSTLSEIGKMAIQLAGVAILTRLLPPSDFGLIALAAVFTTFASLIQDFGTSAALVQRKVINQELISTIFWMNILIGIALCLAVMALAPIAAFLLKEPRLTNVLLTMAIVFPISTAGVMQRALLQRAGRFKTLTRQELTNGICSLVAAIIAAKCGLGVYSLVTQTIVSVTMSTIQTWIVSKDRPTWQWSQTEFRETWHFTSHLLIFRAVTYFARNADNILIGRYLGSVELAWYSMAYRVMLVPLQGMGRVMTRVLLPYYSRDQDDPPKIGRHFVMMLSFLALLFAPAFAMAWGLREPFVVVFFGPKWSRVADVLAWLAPVGLIQTFTYNIGLLLTAVANTRQLRNNGILNTLAFVASFFAGLPFGITGVAASYFAANLILGAYTLEISLRLVGQNLFSLARAIWRQGFFSLIVGLGTWIGDAYLMDHLHAIWRLLLLGCAGSLLYAGLTWLFARDILRDMLQLKNTIGQAPQSLSK
jgi:O-antigen/teichoic acid export membrane protein